MGTELLDRLTGELLDVATAPTTQLAAFMSNLTELRGQLVDAEAIVNTELVDRLDRRAEWTMRLGHEDGQRRWVIKAPSPEAGTVTFDAVQLEVELRKLHSRSTIDQDAAAAALRRRITIELEVPLHVELEALVNESRKWLHVIIAGEQLAIVTVTGSRAVVQAGVNKLAKIKGTAAALKRCRRTAPKKTSAERKATVKLERA